MVFHQLNNRKQGLFIQGWHHSITKRKKNTWPERRTWRWHHNWLRDVSDWAPTSSEVWKSLRICDGMFQAGAWANQTGELGMGLSFFCHRMWGNIENWSYDHLYMWIFTINSSGKSGCKHHKMDLMLKQLVKCSLPCDGVAHQKTKTNMCHVWGRAFIR